MPRGGAREGAGRKKGDKYLVRFWVTADEEAALKGYLARIRAAHKSEADILADLEKTGQVKLFENTAMKTKVNKPTIQSEGEPENIALWEIKTSKKAATAILAQEVCNTINNPFTNDYRRFLSVLAGLMNLLRDKRKRKETFADDNEMAEVFLLRNGYVKHFDENTMRSIWKKSPLHIE